MKRLMIAGLVACFFVGSAISQEAKDVSISVLYYAPKDTDNYDFGIGVEMQTRFWMNNNFGLALAAGVANWEANEQSFSLEDGVERFGLDVDGSAFMFPLGGSVLFKPEISDSVALVFEGGVRYVIVDSNIDVNTTYFDGSDTYTRSDTATIDNGIVGVVGANLEVKADDVITFVGGIGYQFDLMKGDVESLGEDIGDNELEGFFVRVGAVVHF